MLDLQVSPQLVGLLGTAGVGGVPQGVALAVVTDAHLGAEHLINGNIFHFRIPSREIGNFGPALNSVTCFGSASAVWVSSGFSVFHVSIRASEWGDGVGLLS